MAMGGPIDELLDCNGPRLDGSWGNLFEATVEHRASGKGPYNAPRKTFDAAFRVLERWRPAALSALQALPDVFRGVAPIRLLAGFCAQGYITAHFWQCFDIAPTAPAIDVADCLQGLVTGPVDSQDWGPLEFSQSSRWPIQILDIRLLQEHWAGCASKRVVLCSDASLDELRLRSNLGVGHLEANDMHELLQVRDVPSASSSAVARHLSEEPPAGAPFTWPVGHKPEDAFKLVVIGSHMGSNMEPLTLVLAWLVQHGIRVDARVYGTAYPWPEMICQLFRYCERNKEIDEVVGLLVRQMYNPTWKPEDLLATLYSAVQGDPALRHADLFVCAQPMTICSLLRGLTDTPMFIYEAFPLIGATPPQHKLLVLLHYRELVRLPHRSAFVAYSEFLASQFEFQIGQRPLCIRPHSLYATSGIQYDPDRENPRIAVARMAGWARNGAQAFVHLTEAFAERDLRPGTHMRFVFLGMNREQTETVGGVQHPFTYVELRRYRGAVFFPWDFGMLLFSEFYNIGVPLLVPSRAWMAALIKRMLEYTDFGWWQARSDTAIAMPGHSGSSVADDGTPVWPWLDSNSSIAHILSLYDQTDFVRWPYVETFGSLPNLMERLKLMDFDALSVSMRAWNEASLRRSLSIVSRALAALLSDGEPPAVGESSCV